jgi:SAM-dependent methyltransferase
MERYLHGTHAEEQGRLSALNALLNERGLREIAVRPGERIVDFGCGLGQLTRKMARASGVRIVGIERSAAQLAEAARQAAAEAELVEFRQGDVLDPPLRSGEWGSFDLAHARFVLEHVSDPLAVVKQMAYAVRSGGRVVLQDDDHEILRAYPEPPGFMTLWRAYERTYARLGCDPYVGRRLPSLLHQAGLRPSRCTFLFFGACAGEPSWRGLIENMIGLFNGARDAMVIERDAFDTSVNNLKTWAARPDASFWYAIFYAEGVKP